MVQKTTGIKHKSHDVEKNWKPKSSTKQHGYASYSFEDPVEHLHLDGLLCAKPSQIHNVPADTVNQSKWQVLNSLASIVRDRINAGVVQPASPTHCNLTAP